MHACVIIAGDLSGREVRKILFSRSSPLPSDGSHTGRNISRISFIIIIIDVVVVVVVVVDVAVVVVVVIIVNVFIVIILV